MKNLNLWLLAAIFAVLLALSYLMGNSAVTDEMAEMLYFSGAYKHLEKFIPR